MVFSPFKRRIVCLLYLLDLACPCEYFLGTKAPIFTKSEEYANVTKNSPCAIFNKCAANSVCGLKVSSWESVRNHNCFNESYDV